jgi:hypothetical protein
VTIRLEALSRAKELYRGFDPDSPNYWTKRQGKQEMVNLADCRLGRCEKRFLTGV